MDQREVVVVISFIEFIEYRGASVGVQSKYCTSMEAVVVAVAYGSCGSGGGGRSPL